MSDEPVVAVRGEAFRDVDPEVATFSITVSARDKDRDTVLRALTQRQERVRAVLDGYTAAIEKRESTGAQVYPEGRKGSGERVTAHSGQFILTITVGDFAALGPLILAVAAEDQVAVNGPWWGLRPGSPVHRAARRAAIHDAIDRAREYADALGARVEALELLADAGLLGAGGPGGYRDAAMYRTPRSASAGSGSGDGTQLDLQPQRQEVYAAVEARFRISTPGVLAAD